MLTGARLLMTGMTGQVGSSIARLLAPHNEIMGIARFTREGSREAVEAMGITPVACDYTTGNFDGIPDDVDYVLHVAADVFPENIDVGVQQNAEGAGLLFNHVRKAKAWIYVSTTGVYWDHPDPWYRYKETDRLGGSTRITSRFAYGTSKFAGEAVARTMSRIHNVPVTIPRLNWSYGLGGHGGLPVGMMRRVLAGQAVTINPDWEFVGGPIHEDDLAEHVEGFFEGATVGGTVVNWAGDDAISVEQMVPWLADLMGVEYSFVYSRDATAYPRATDNTKRVSLVGECKVKWQDGFRRVLREKFPEVDLKGDS
jgi:UDP-glucuronate 4-epimerase